MIEITLTTIAAYGSSVAGEQLHYSGVIATVVAGMLRGNYAARTGMWPATRIAAETFWEYVAFALLRGTRERMPGAWTAVLTWGGLRGGLSMVLALALSVTFPHRDLLVTMTFAVVIVSILAQGLTMSPILRWPRIVRANETRAAYDRFRGESQAVKAALAELETMARTGAAPPDILRALREEYVQRVAQAEQRVTGLHLERQQLRDDEALHARRHLLLVEKDHLMDALNRGALSREAGEKPLVDVDARLLQLESEGAGPAVSKEPPES